MSCDAIQQAYLGTQWEIKEFDEKKYKEYKKIHHFSKEMARKLARYESTPYGLTVPYADLFERTKPYCQQIEQNCLAKWICEDLTVSYHCCFAGSAHKVQNLGKQTIGGSKTLAVSDFPPDFLADIVLKVHDQIIDQDVGRNLIKWKLMNPENKASIDTILSNDDWYPKSCEEVKQVVNKHCSPFLKYDPVNVDVERLVEKSMLELKGRATKECVLHAIRDLASEQNQNKVYAVDTIKDVLEDWTVIKDRFPYKLEDLLKARITALQRSSDVLKSLLESI